MLDVPCGQGRHSHLLAEAGYDVDGLDYSDELLSVARKRGTAGHLRYVRGDMRQMLTKWTARFDAVLNLFTSFGFFAHPSDDARVIAEFARVLKPDGVLVWHGGNRDGVMARFLQRDWWTTSDNTLFAQEREFDPLSGVLTVHSTWRRGTKSGTREHRLRLYTATRLSELCADAGLVVEEAFAQPSRHSKISERTRRASSQNCRSCSTNTDSSAASARPRPSAAPLPDMSSRSPDNAVRAPIACLMISQ